MRAHSLNLKSPRYTYTILRGSARQMLFNEEAVATASGGYIPEYGVRPHLTPPLQKKKGRKRKKEKKRKEKDHPLNDFSIVENVVKKS